MKKKRLLFTLVFVINLSAQLFSQSGTIYVKTFGAKGDGVTDDTRAIQAAIDSSIPAGGGHVIVSPGNYIIGPIHLRSNLTFEIEAGATLWCTENVGAFFKTGRELTVSEISKWKGLHTDFQMINGIDLENVTITGKGTINGQGKKVWWRIQDIRPYVMKIENSKNIFFEDLFITESPFHTFSFTGVESLVIRGITLRNEPKSPNTDGLHIFGCKSVRISEVDLDTGDDCILTGGSTDVVVSNSRFRTPWGFWWPNSSCRNITITGCVIDCQMLIKDFRNSENVVISDIVATGPGKLFSSYGGIMKNVMISNLIATGWSQGGWFIGGENIILSNIHIIRKPGSGNDILKNGLTFTDVKGLTLRNVTIDSVETGSALYCENVTNLEIDGFRSTGVPVTDPAIYLKNVNGVYMHENFGKPGEILASIEGKNSGGITYRGNEWNGAMLNVSAEVDPSSVSQIHARVSVFTMPSEIESDTPFTVNAEVESMDNFAGLYPMTCSIDGKVTETKWVWLKPGEKKSLSLEGSKLYESRIYNVSVNDMPAKTISVKPGPGRLSVKSVELPWQGRITSVNKPVTIKALVRNVGSSRTEFPVILKSDGKQFSSKLITLNPGEEGTVSFEYISSKSGLHNLTINESWESIIKSYNDPLQSAFLQYNFEKIDKEMVFDNSGLGYHGLLGSNAGGFKPVQEPGIFGQAISFNGNSSYLKIPSLLLKFPMTISVWVKPGKLLESSTAGRQMIFYVSELMGNDGYGPEPEIHLMRSEGNTFVFWANAGRQRIDLRYPLGEEGTWSLITIVYAETSKMYINGELVSSQSGIKPPAFGKFADRIYVGRPNVDYLRFFNGVLDEITFFNEALDDKQVNALYKGYKIK